MNEKLYKTFINIAKIFLCGFQNTLSFNFITFCSDYTFYVSFVSIFETIGFTKSFFVSNVH